MPTCPSCGSENSESSFFCGRCRLYLKPVGDYTLRESIGKGGFARVYRAQNRYTQQPAAVKVLHSEHDEVVRVDERFRREAELLHHMHSPHVVQIYDYGVLDELGPYLVMEWLDGQPLHRLLERQPNHRFSRQDALRLFSQLLYGLHHIHSRDIIHRDIKPQNLIVVRSRGEQLLKILDFGLAWVEGEELTQTGTFIGTTSFMAPEQFRGEKHRYGPATDLYAAGLVFAWMLTGQTPFSGETPAQLALQHVTQPAPTLAQLWPQGHFPDRYEKAVARALAKEPEERFSSAMEFLEALQDESEPLPAPPVLDDPTGPVAFSETAEMETSSLSQLRPRRQLPWLGFAMVLFIFGAFAFGYSLIMERARKKHAPYPRSKDRLIHMHGTLRVHTTQILKAQCAVFEKQGYRCEVGFTGTPYAGKKIFYRAKDAQEARRLNAQFFGGSARLLPLKDESKADFLVVFGTPVGAQLVPKRPGPEPPAPRITQDAGAPPSRAVPDHKAVAERSTVAERATVGADAATKLPAWLNARVKAWQEAWQATAKKPFDPKLAERYKSFFHSGFFHQTRKMNKQAYTKHALSIAKVHPWIHVHVSRLVVHSATSTAVTMQFHQGFQTSTYGDMRVVHMQWRQEDGQWRIWRASQKSLIQGGDEGDKQDAKSRPTPPKPRVVP